MPSTEGHIASKHTRVHLNVLPRMAKEHSSAQFCMETHRKRALECPILYGDVWQNGHSSAHFCMATYATGHSSALRGASAFRRGRSSAFEGSSGVSSEALECPSRGPRRFAEALECLRGGPRPSSEALECPGKRCRQRRVGCRGGGCCRIELRVASGGEGRSGLRRPGSLSSIGLWKHSFSAALPFRHRAGVSARNLGSAEAPSGATSGWNAEKEDRRRGSPRGARVQIPSAFLKRFASENMSTFVNT